MFFDVVKRPALLPSGLPVFLWQVVINVPLGQCKIGFFITSHNLFASLWESKKVFCWQWRTKLFLCTLPACQQTSAIGWCLYLHSLKSYEALWYIMCFMVERFWSKMRWTEQCILLRDVFLQEIESVSSLLNVFVTLLNVMDVVVIKWKIVQKWMEFFCLLIIFTVLLVDFKTDKSCDFWSIGSVFDLNALFEHMSCWCFCIALMFSSWKCMFDLYCFITTKWCCDCWCVSDFCWDVFYFIYLQNLLGVKQIQL